MDTPNQPTGDADATVSIPREALVPPPPGAAPAVALTASPPPPPGAAREGPTRGGGGAVWIGVVVVATLLFVGAAYFVVDRAESDGATGGGATAPTTDETGAPTTPVPTTTAPPAETRDPATVTVAVLNGTEQRGWAGENGDLLETAGFTTTRTDAAADPDVTTIYVADPSFEPDAAAVAAALGLPDAPVEARPAEPLASDSSDQAADIVVVLGADSLG